MPNTELVYWRAAVPSKCDICRRGIGDTFFDLKIKGESCWACVCPACRKAYGPATLGPGLGQRYDRQENDCWLKTEG